MVYNYRVCLCTVGDQSEPHFVISRHWFGHILNIAQIPEPELLKISHFILFEEFKDPVREQHARIPRKMLLLLLY